MSHGSADPTIVLENDKHAMRKEMSEPLRNFMRPYNFTAAVACVIKFHELRYHVMSKESGGDGDEDDGVRMHSPTPSYRGKRQCCSKCKTHWHIEEILKTNELSDICLNTVTI